MVVGFTVIVLIGYNGIIDKPGSGPAEIGVSLDYGYWLALLCTIAIAATGFLRSQVGPAASNARPRAPSDASPGSAVEAEEAASSRRTCGRGPSPTATSRSSSCA